MFVINPSFRSENRRAVFMDKNMRVKSCLTALLSVDENSWKTQSSCSVLQLCICVVGKIPIYTVVMVFFFPVLTIELFSIRLYVAL